MELLRNTSLNLAQSFALGYMTKSQMLSYFSAGIGVVVMLVMAWHGMFLSMALLLAGVAGFVLYFPPIPAYMFGNYLLLAWVLVHVVDLWLDRMGLVLSNRMRAK
jgi:hypothetical protein